jgi:hypothetical protein
MVDIQTAEVDGKLECGRYCEIVYSDWSSED